jgi:hypothetical protein
MLMSSTFSFAQDTIKVMWYNILNYPEINSARISYLQTILQYEKPDIFVVCEITSPAGASTILNTALNVGTTNYAMVNYTDGPDDENMLFYNTAKIGFKDQNEIQASPRQFNEYILYYKDPSLNAASDTAYLYFYAAHLKAGNTSSDASERASAASVLKSYLNTRPFAENTILGGDMNIYGSSESAYTIFTGEVQANLFDPIGAGEYHSNPSFAIHHTQSTRVVAIDGGSTGGMDDRFDMMLFSDDIRYGSNGVQFLNGSYRAVGQDGQHYNLALNEPANNSVPANILNALYYMSDHLPITMKLLAGGGVGIEEHGSGMEGLKVYPNPAKDKITYFLNETDELFVSLSDISGRVVLTKKGSGSQNLDISSFAKGSYSLRIASAKGIVTRKIILE